MQASYKDVQRTDRRLLWRIWFNYFIPTLSQREMMSSLELDVANIQELLLGCLRSQIKTGFLEQPDCPKLSLFPSLFVFGLKAENQFIAPSVPGKIYRANATWVDPATRYPVAAAILSNVTEQCECSAGRGTFSAYR
ncbi:MAG: hypothetical protein Pars2KO_24230 [Parasphingorhabdus sp.]